MVSGMLVWKSKKLYVWLTCCTTSRESDLAALRSGGVKRSMRTPKRPSHLVSLASNAVRARQQHFDERPMTSLKAVVPRCRSKSEIHLVRPCEVAFLPSNVLLQSVGVHEHASEHGKKRPVACTSVSGTQHATVLC